MAVQYINEEYMNAYISEILSELKAWIDSDKNLALKKVDYQNNSLIFYKNPEATEDDAPDFSIDFPAERFLDQTKTTLVQNFVWSEETYSSSENPEFDGNPVLVLAVKGNDDKISYSFLNMKSLFNIYQASAEPSTITITIDINSNTISGAVNISSDSDNNLSIGSDGGLYSSPTDLSKITSQIQELRALYDSLNDRITAIETSLNTESET